MAVATAQRVRPQFHDLRVADVRRLTDDAVAVTFAVPDELAAAYDFTAGQSLTLRRVLHGREHRRSYSICSAAGEAPRVGVREIPGGMFSSWLTRDLVVGDVVEVQTPSGTLGGDFWSGDTRAGRHLCIASGSGITPVLSVAATVLRDRDAQVTLVYGNRTTGSVMFAEELADLKNRYGPRLNLVHVLSREPRDTELFSGRLDADRLRRLLPAMVPLAAVDHAWLCGPYGLAAGAQEVLTELGVEPAQVHVELFYVDEPPPELQRVSPVVEGEVSEVTVVLDGRTTTAPVGKDRSVLDGAAATRSDVPFACKGGVCGTCRAKVVDGEVEMRRNYALGDDEVSAGFVLTCQSHPVSDRVVVDYDA